MNTGSEERPTNEQADSSAPAHRPARRQGHPMKIWRALHALHAMHENEVGTLARSSRAALGAALRALSATAYGNSEHAWRTRKGPMALYHRAVAIIAKRVARTMTRDERTERTSRRIRRTRRAKQFDRSERTLSVAAPPYGTGVATRSASVELNETWAQIFAGIEAEELRSVCATLRYLHGLEGLLADEAWRRRRQSRALFHRVASVYAGHMRRAATKALGDTARHVEGDRERARANIPETSNEAVLRSHG